MPNLASIDTFQGGEFEEYAERLEFYFLANDVGKLGANPTDDEKAAADKKKCAVLISLLSATVYSTLKSLCLPDKPADKKFEDIQKLLLGYYKPELSAVAATYQFQHVQAKDGETVRDFVNRVKKAAVPCDFGAHNDRALRDQFIAGLRDSAVRQEILSRAAEMETFQAVVDFASGREAAARASQQLTPAASAVHAVSAKGKPPSSSASSKPKTKCFRCDRTGHSPDDCYFRRTKCNYCETVGHIEKACNKKKSAGKTGRHSVKHVTTQPSQEPGESVPCNVTDPENVVPMLNVKSCNGGREANSPFMLSVSINGTPVPLEIDTGSALTLLNERDFLHCQGKLEELHRPTIKLTTYTKEEIACLGEVEMEMAIGDQHGKILVRITKADSPSILGRDAMLIFTLPWKSVKKVHAKTEKDWFAKYPELFDTTSVGKVKGVQVQLHVCDESPVYKKARPVPFAIREKYLEALDKLEAEGIIEKVDHAQWASPTVPVLKPDGSLRICADYSGTVNLHSECEQYPLPTLEELLHKLGPTPAYRLGFTPLCPYFKG